jgi:L-asparaginase II
VNTSSALGASDSLALAFLLRDGVTESIHHGIVAVVDQDGNSLLERGNTKAPVYPRSTLKPLQALAVLKTGVTLTGVETVLTTASHSGSQRHRDAVTAFLVHHDLEEKHLQCPVDWPLGAAERQAMQAQGKSPDRLAMNCSGKHAGFLAACRHQGFDLDSYLDPKHPLQQLIVETIEEWTSEGIAFSSTDGCGAPLHQVSLHGLARGIARVAVAKDPAASTLVGALADNPWAIDGDNRANTRTIERLGGIAKIGAEGLVVIGVPQGVAVAVKILDGSMRATTPVALEALHRVGAITADDRDALLDAVQEPVMGGEQIIGGLEVRL